MEEVTEITEAPPVTSPPAGDCDRPQRKRGRRRGRRRPWALLALTLTAVAAACVSVLSFHRVRVLRSELSALRSELHRQREEGHGGATHQQAGKPEDPQGVSHVLFFCPNLAGALVFQRTGNVFLKGERWRWSCRSSG